MPAHVVRFSTTLAIFLALTVVLLGAYTRLTGAGLGCPDWPGCYGQLVLPANQVGLQQAQAAYPEKPLETQKAWTEMLHRYVAGSLALVIFFIALAVAYQRQRGVFLPWHIPAFLCLLVIFQAVLGWWTVTLKLLPIVVLSHLLGGMLIFACLSRFRWQLSSFHGQELVSWRFWLRLGLFILLIQIALGGWVSANYAGLSCIGFPQCNGLWWPKWYFSQGFNLFSPVGANYQGGVLDSEVRMSIQLVHRLGAVLTLSYLLGLAFMLIWRAPLSFMRLGGSAILALVLGQFSLGVLNVLYWLPLPVALAHNGVAALLLALIFSLLHGTYSGVKHER